MWTISPQAGAAAVQHSADGGSTWETVHIADGVTFEAIAAVRSHVRAGGDGGALFHSSDKGRQWARIPVLEGTHTLTGAITSLTAKSPFEVELKTSTRQRWITTDGGRHWRQE